MPKAIITGVLGQDGSYLTELLLEKEYEVCGVYRRVSTGNNWGNIETVKEHPNLHLVCGDICDAGFITELVSGLKPELFFNTAAQSHVGQSFKEPVQTLRIDGEAVLIQLEAIRSFSPQTRYLQCSTSELYGGLNCPLDGYTELNQHHPRSPYGTAKEFAFNTVVNYREAYNLFACNAVCFNHSSPKRGLDFAARKITHGIASIKLGLQEQLLMGNLTPFRDEGASQDYTRAMHLILQQDKPEDFVVATGTGATIEEELRYVCDLAELRFEDVYRQDERFMRPSDVPYLLGNPSKIKAIGWKPKYTWQSLLKEMYENDLKVLSSGTN